MLRRMLPAAARSRVVATSLLAALSLSLSACTGQSEPESAPTQRPSASATATPSTPPASATPTEPATSASQIPASASPTVSPTQPSATVDPSEDVPSAAPVDRPPPGSGPEAMLLRPAEMPGLNEQFDWRGIGTEHGEPKRLLWGCQVVDFFSIGATDVWTRRFTGGPGSDAKARSTVLTFADDTSAQRAYAVLRAWHQDCEEQLRQKYDRIDLDAAPTAIDVEQGAAQWRLAIYGPAEGEREAAYFDATGYVIDGSRISLTTMVNVGQDYNYPRGEEPIVGAVQNSAIKLRG